MFKKNPLRGANGDNTPTVSAPYEKKTELVVLRIPATLREEDDITTYGGIPGGWHRN